MEKTQQPLLEVRNITKVFPGVKALDNVDMQLASGEVRALVGENGAGKSTLIKIIAGVYQPNEGQIFIDGKQEEIADPYHALKLGIAPVHQEVNLEPYLSVAENIFIGRQPKSRFGLIDYDRMNREATEWLKLLGVTIEPTLPLGMASIAERQMVAIARAVSMDAKIMIFDEPTSSLSQNEVESLFNVIRKLKEKALSIIYISHRLEEVFKICDSITIMRDGEVVTHEELSNLDTPSIIRMMIGRDQKDMYDKSTVELGEPVLQVKNLCVKGILRDISFDLKAGEIVGVTGLVGAGRTELARALFGDLPITSGSLHINGKEIKIRSPKDVIQAGIGFIPEDRKEQGLVIDMSVIKNISMAIMKRISTIGFINLKKETNVAKEYINQMSIKTPSVNQEVKYLSGGNQQRVVIAKWLATHPKILIVDEPTRGIDVGAKADIYHLLNNLSKDGVAILMISSELPEIIAMSNRVLVIYHGRLQAELSGENINQELILHHAIGRA